MKWLLRVVADFVCFNQLTARVSAVFCFNCSVNGNREIGRVAVIDGYRNLVDAVVIKRCFE